MTAEKTSNAYIRGWGLFAVGAALFFVGLGIGDGSPLLAVGAWAVVIGWGFLAYGWLLRRRRA